MRKILVMGFCLGLASASTSFAGANDLINGYRSAGATGADPDAGQKLWEQAFDPEHKGEQRKCSTCHTSDLKRSGKHARTGKVIEPMAPSANRARLTDAQKVEKWFKRNCKWTLGRECTPQEKADFVAFIYSQ